MARTDHIRIRRRCHKQTATQGSFLMRLLALAIFAGLVASPAHADTQQNCEAAWDGMAPDAQSKTTRDQFISACQNAHTTAGAAAIKPPSDATAKCADGSYSMSPSPADQCAGHGGTTNDPRKN